MNTAQRTQNMLHAAATFSDAYTPVHYKAVTLGLQTLQVKKTPFEMESTDTL